MINSENYEKHDIREGRITQDEKYDKSYNKTEKGRRHLGYKEMMRLYFLSPLLLSKLPYPPPPPSVSSFLPSSFPLPHL